MIERILRVQPYVLKYAKEFGVDPALVNGIIRCESGFRPNAISPAGAVGLTQIMPGTKKGWSKQLGVSGDLMDPEFSIRLGTYGISKILRNWKGDVDKALAAYNWGGGNLQKHGLEAAPKKTHGYIKCVKRHQKKFQRAS